MVLPFWGNICWDDYVGPIDRGRCVKALTGHKQRMGARRILHPQCQWIQVNCFQVKTIIVHKWSGHYTSLTASVYQQCPVPNRFWQLQVSVPWQIMKYMGEKLRFPLQPSVKSRLSSNNRAFLTKSAISWSVFKSIWQMKKKFPL